MSINQVEYVPLNIEHAKQVFEYLQDDDLYNFIPDKKYTKIEDLEHRYQKLTQGSGRNDELWFNWVMFKDTAFNQPIGMIQTTIFPEKGMAYIGYVIFKPFWNQGYATSAIQYLDTYIAQHYSIPKIEAYVDPNNIASIKVLEKNLFQYSHQDENDFAYVKNY